jgi:capsular polysaccharide biosynthesis protein
LVEAEGFGLPRAKLLIRKTRFQYHHWNLEIQRRLWRFIFTHVMLPEALRMPKKWQMPLIRLLWEHRQAMEFDLITAFLGRRSGPLQFRHYGLHFGLITPVNRQIICPKCLPSKIELWKKQL